MKHFLFILIMLFFQNTFSQNNQYLKMNYHVILLKNNDTKNNSLSAFDYIKVLNVINSNKIAKKNAVVLLKYINEKKIFIIQIIEPKLAKKLLDFKNDKKWSTTFYNEFYSCFDNCSKKDLLYRFYKYNIKTNTIKCYDKEYPN